jgi:hypothetical protein
MCLTRFLFTIKQLWVSLYVILHELAEGSSKCFKFHYLVVEINIIGHLFFVFVQKKIYVDRCRFDFFVPDRGFTLENPNWLIFYVFVARFSRS